MRIMFHTFFDDTLVITLIQVHGEYYEVVE
jgi:hypothetical protein